MHAGMGLGKPRPSWSSIWQGMWRGKQEGLLPAVKEQENVDLMLNGVRGPHGKGHGRNGGTRFSLPWSLLVKPTFSTFSNLRYLRPVGKSLEEDLPRWRKIRSGNI